MYSLLDYQVNFVHQVYYFITTSHFLVAVVVVAPISQNVIEGSIATFNCSGTNLAFLTWQINNDIVSNGEEYQSVTVTRNRSIVSSLSIRALPKYNNSSILCVQFQNLTAERKFEAHLRIQGICQCT